jgi:hypothetical protein
VKHGTFRPKNPSSSGPTTVPRTSSPLATTKSGSRQATRRTATVLVAVAVSALALAAVASSTRSGACAFCGKNLIKNPGAELGRGQTTPNESGAVPGWTKTAGGFGAAAYSFSGGWITTTSAGPKDKGKNYFFGGTGSVASSVPANVGTQTIKVPAAAAGHKAALSGWIGNYGTDTAQVRAEFMDASGKVISSIRIGPSTSVPYEGMGERSRAGTVPPGTRSISVVITFTDHVDDDFAGVDDLSLVLS